MITKKDRSRIKSHKPAVLWFTGLSAAGKSTIACLTEAELNGIGAHTVLLDGDNLRLGLNRDLGFTNADRAENVRRVGEVAKLMTEAGLIVICALISPFSNRTTSGASTFRNRRILRDIRRHATRDLHGARPKGLYKRALAGEIPNFTGIQQPYEPPENPELILRTSDASPYTSVDQVVEMLHPLIARL